MNLSTATVRPGDSTATFCIRLPRFQGQASSNMRMLGRVVDVTYNSLGVRDIPYFLSVSADYYQKTHAFFIKTERRQDNSLQNVARKLDTHNDNLAKVFPLQQSLPTVSLNVDNNQDNHFVVSLPPRTAFYTSSELFFRALGLDRELELEQRMREMGRGEKRLPVNKIVYGAFNESYNAVQFRGRTVDQTQTLRETLPRDADLPDAIFLQVEFMGADGLVMRTPPGEAVMQPASKENAVRMLRIQTEMIRQRLNLKTNLIEVLPGPRDTVYIGNRAFPGANMTLSIQFNNFMADAYGWQQGQQMVFPLEAARTYDIQVQSQKQDPFSELYPITMRMAGFGSSNSYVQDHGYAAIMAYMRERGGGDIDLTTVGMLFDSDATYITMEFLDKLRRVVQFKDGHEISLLMKFQSL